MIRRDVVCELVHFKQWTFQQYYVTDLIDRNNKNANIYNMFLFYVMDVTVGKHALTCSTGEA